MCGGVFEDKNAPFMVDIDNRYFIVKNVPSQVCKQCGEVSYNHEIASQTRKLIEEMKRMNNEVVIADFTENTESKKKEMNKNFVETPRSFEVAMDSLVGA